MGFRRMMKEQNSVVASHPATDHWERRARFKAKFPSGRLNLLYWTSASHNQEETALLHTQDTSLSGQPTHLELCTVLSCAAFTQHEAGMGKAGFGPAVAAGTNSHLTAKASPRWGLQFWLMLLQSLAQNKPPITLQKKELGPGVPLQPDERTKYVQVSNSQVWNEQRLLRWQYNRGLHRVKHHSFLWGQTAHWTPGSSSPFTASEWVRQISGDQHVITAGSRIS